MTAPAAPPGPHRDPLAAARTGDERAYGELVAPYRRELHAHCYRMLGSFHDAEEALQDTLLRAWRGLAGFSGRSSVRTWLHTIATNVCLTALERRPRGTLPVDYGPAADPGDESSWVAMEARWVDPYPDAQLGSGNWTAAPAARYEAREAVELAFVAAFQHLPATQRAVLILRDVLGFSAKEAAASLGTTVASVTSALQRARNAVERRLPERSQQSTLRTLGDARLRRTVDDYVEAWERGDAAAILAMLADDATFSLPPYPVWYAGRDDIAAFLPAGPLRERWRVLPIRANGQVAFGFYRWDERQDRYLGHSIDVVALRGGTIAEITAFIDAGLLDRFGLPPHLPSVGTRLPSLPDVLPTRSVRA